MSGGKFTPGPWESGYGEFDGWYIGVFLPREGNAKPRTICRIAPLNNIDEQDEANARLIAAAPEMFELLERAKFIIGNEYGWTKQWEALKKKMEVKGEDGKN